MFTNRFRIHYQALLLLNYGFTLRNNNQDEVAISLDLETIRSLRLPLHDEESTRERSFDKSKLLLGGLFDQGYLFCFHHLKKNMLELGTILLLVCCQIGIQSSKATCFNL